MTQQTKHTSGPWHVEKAVGRYEIWRKDDGTTHTYVAVAQTDSDARLIALSPEMLDFIMEVKVWLMAPNLDHDTLENMQAQAESLITKATQQ